MTTPDPMATPVDPTPVVSRTAGVLVLPALAGGLVALALGVYGKVHDGAGIGVLVAGFSTALAAKAWMTTVATAFGVIQVVSALSMYGKLGRAPSWIGFVHRWSGRAAFLVAVPVAVHCLYALGFQATDGRVLLHSLLGCLFFGAFTVKMLCLRSDRVPGWALPVLGGVVFVLLVAVWLLSSVWFFNKNGLTT